MHFDRHVHICNDDAKSNEVEQQISKNNFSISKSEKFQKKIIKTPKNK